MNSQSVSIKDFKKINDYLWEIPKSFRPDMPLPARIYASERMLNEIFGDQSINQLISGTFLPGMVKYSIAMPDCHEGYSVPIGFVGAIKISDGVISPGACGFDINCGIKLLKSEYSEKEIRPHLENLAAAIQKEVPSGLGKGGRVKLSLGQVERILEGGIPYLVKEGHGEKEDIENCEGGGSLGWADSSAVSSYAKNRARDQVGTLGSGNHFLELQRVDEIFDEKTANAFGLFKDQIVIMIHTGSRGLGHQVCTDYLKEFIPLMANKYKIKVFDREFACVPFDSSEGQRYFRAMASAANYAWANRQMIACFIRKTWKEVLGQKNSSLSSLYDVAHNIIKKEKHAIEGKETELAVHRKGATRAFPPDHCEVPEKYRSFGQPTFLPGTMGTASYVMAGQQTGQEAFYSTAHGAGRIMSRHAAIKRFSGQEVINSLESKGIVIKCRSHQGIAEEAPMAYKDVESVVEIIHNAGLSRKVAKLMPLAVIKGE